MTSIISEPEGFREEIRTWISDNKPSGLESLADWSVPWAAIREYEQVQRAEGDPIYHEWERRLLAARLICPQWPESVGGRSWDPVRLTIFEQECREAGVPRVRRGFGENLVGPALIQWGTKEQKDRLLPRIVDGTDVYCQGYSEPDYGSDLGGVRTRGVVDGDEMVINGQKIWTDGAHFANMIFLLCRTDTRVPKHRGLSFVLMSLDQPGHVDVRPIRMINGSAHFCEEFFEDARAPLSNVIGGLNNGWQVAMLTLSYERGGEYVDQHLVFEREFWQVVEAARSGGSADDPDVRDGLVWSFMRLQFLRFAGMRTLTRLQAGLPVSRHESINKILWSEYHRRLGEIAIGLDGVDGLVRPSGPGYPLSRWQDLFLSTRAGTIHSGTNEIQRNIIAERVLGLPKEPAAASTSAAGSTS